MYKDRLESKMKAKTAMRGNAVALFFTAVLIALPSSAVSSFFSGLKSLFENGSAIYLILGTLSGVCGAIITVFTVPLYAGLAAKYLAVSRGGTTRDETVFCYYRSKDWLEKIKAYLLVAIFVLLGSICFVIPGIIFAIKYSMLGFVFADNPGISYRDAMDKCVELTRGRKWEIFVFHLSFIGWHLLALLTFGILEIWVVPYQEIAFAAYYDILRPFDDEKSGGNSFDEGIPVADGPISDGTDPGNVIF